MSRLEIGVSRWSAWQQRECVEYWQFDGQELTKSAPEKPDLAWVPALKRRRLSALARVVFQVLGDCSDDGEQIPVVFSSGMGELARTQNLLEAIASDAPLSPTAFSLSVHNATGGMWSMQRDVRAPVIALAPSEQSPVPALLEAAGLLDEGAQAVTVVFYEAPFPEFYTPFMNSPAEPFALALRLCRAQDNEGGVCLALDCEPVQAAPDAAHNRQALLSLLLAQTGSVPINEAQSRWVLSQC